MPTINEMIDFCEEFASYDCFSNEQFARREMFYAISDELKKALREQKRPHGEWIDLSDGWQEGTFMCSSCQMEFVLLEGTPEDNEYNFCPECGADMRKKEGEVE